MRKFAILIPLILLVLASCMEEDLDQSEAPTRSPSTPVFLPTATATVVPPLSDIEVKRALISLTDLPSTWYNADTREPADTSSERCDLPNPFVANLPIAEATETFSTSQTGPWIAETIFQMESPDHAQALMDDMRLSFSCGTWTQIVEPEPTPTPVASATAEPTATQDPDATPTEEEPTEIIWDVAAPDDLDLRNSTFIARMISNTAEPIEFEMVFIRENNLVILVSHWAREGVSNEITMSIVDRSLAKLDATFTG